MLLIYKLCVRPPEKAGSRGVSNGHNSQMLPWAKGKLRGLTLVHFAFLCSSSKAPGVNGCGRRGIVGTPVLRGEILSEFADIHFCFPVDCIMAKRCKRGMPSIWQPPPPKTGSFCETFSTVGWESKSEWGFGLRCSFANRYIHLLEPEGELLLCLSHDWDVKCCSVTWLSFRFSEEEEKPMWWNNGQEIVLVFFLLFIWLVVQKQPKSYQHRAVLYKENIMTGPGITHFLFDCWMQLFIRK